MALSVVAGVPAAFIAIDTVSQLCDLLRHHADQVRGCAAIALGYLSYNPEAQRRLLNRSVDTATGNLHYTETTYNCIVHFVHPQLLGCSLFIVILWSPLRQCVHTYLNTVYSQLLEHLSKIVSLDIGHLCIKQNSKCNHDKHV